MDQIGITREPYQPEQPTIRTVLGMDQEGNKIMEEQEVLAEGKGRHTILTKGVFTSIGDIVKEQNGENKLMVGKEIVAVMVNGDLFTTLAIPETMLLALEHLEDKRTIVATGIRYGTDSDVYTSIRRESLDPSAKQFLRDPCIHIELGEGEIVFPPEAIEFVAVGQDE